MVSFSSCDRYASAILLLLRTRGENQDWENNNNNETNSCGNESTDSAEEMLFWNRSGLMWAEITRALKPVVERGNTQVGAGERKDRGIFVSHSSHQ